MVYKFLDKKSASLNKSSGSGVVNKPNYYSFFKDNIWGVDLADMQSLSKYNKRINYLLCVIDILSKYEWVVFLKVKKGTSIVNVF